MTSEVSNEMPGADAAPAVETQEKMIPQSYVNKLVGEAKQRGRAQALSEVQQAQQQGHESSFNMQNSGGKEDIRKIIADEFSTQQDKLREEAAKFQAQQAYQQTANEVTQKVNEASKRIPDYAETMAQVGHFSEAPGIVMLANSVDNTGDVLYELAKNPMKLGSILSALQANTPTIARSQIVSLSKSIKQNQEASGDKIPDEPLSQPKPTNFGVGKASVSASDFAKQYRGRY